MTGTRTGTAVLDVTPGPMEVAAVYLPPGAELTWDGKPVAQPDPDFGWFGEIGWGRVSGGADYVWRMTPRSLRNGRNEASRPAWGRASGILSRAARWHQRPAVVYVVIEELEEYGRPVLVATGVRRGDQLESANDNGICPNGHRLEKED